MIKNIFRIVQKILAYLNIRCFDCWLLPHAVCVYIPNQQGQVLAVSRKDDNKKFSLPGGKVEKGESNISAAIRELREETGVLVIPLELKKIFESADDSGYWVTCYELRPFYILNQVQDLFIFNTSETGVVKWVDRQDLLNGPFSDYNRKVFDVTSAFAK